MTTVATTGYPSPVLAQCGIPVLMPPSGYFANNGIYVVGQAPSSAATVSFSGTSGVGVTMTFSAATLLGTSADNGRVLTILDGGTYKYATITTFSSTTVATVTLTGNLSGTGPFANNILWLTGSAYNAGNTVAFSSFFPQAYANCFMNFPVNVIAAGVAAGTYFAKVLSTIATVFTVYNNLIGTGTPRVPVAPLAFATTGPGAFAQTVGSNVTLATVAVLANTVGPYGRLHHNFTNINNNSANTKTFTVTFGGVNVNLTSNTTLNSDSSDHHLLSSGAANAQQTSQNTGIGQTSIPAFLNVDTTANQNLLFLGQLANANDWMGYNYFLVEVFPGA